MIDAINVNLALKWDSQIDPDHLHSALFPLQSIYLKEFMAL